MPSSHLLLSNISQLFVSLQVFVVGLSLGAALRKMKRGEASSSIPWIPSLFVLVVRFVIWPVISISVV
jgi:auxin efflux carrier family protein